MYTAKISLAATPTHENLKKIIDRGLALGCNFSYDENSALLTCEEVIEKFFLDFSHANDPLGSLYESGIIGAYQHSTFCLYIYKENRYFALSFLALGGYQYKYINDEEYFDFGYYIKFLIDFCEDFPIISIETSAQ